jgi:hypothetical protein
MLERNILQRSSSKSSQGRRIGSTEKAVSKADAALLLTDDTLELRDKRLGRVLREVLGGQCFSDCLLILALFFIVDALTTLGLCFFLP